MQTQYFNPSMDSETMKKLYKKLVREFHPDLHPTIDIKIIQQINAEYAFWYARVSSSEVYTRKSTEQPDKDWSKYTSQAYIDSLQAMIQWIYDNNIDRGYSIDVELIGVFIWISGLTYEMKEAREKVKAVGFQGSWKHHDDGSKDYMWKWTPEIRRFGANPNIDSIKRTYGSESYKRQQNALA